MSNQSIRIRREDIQPGDVIVVTAAGDPYITVAREVQTDYAPGTVVQVSSNRYFRTSEGWIGRSGAKYTLEEMQSELNSPYAKVVLKA